jgi:SAM-dependent methyltransferase
MSWWVADLSPGDVVRKIRNRVIPNMHHLARSRVRVCGACQRLTVVLAFGAGEELHLCVRCRANLRFEMLARHIRRAFPDISRLDVLELDYGSPLRRILEGAHSYTRSFYRDHVTPGTVRTDGAVCQDITRLTFPNASLDLIVSSDVLEHVPDLALAFRESARVLRPGGAHVFTVPVRPATLQRCKLENGQVVNILPPEYHSDPLDPAGVLTFWDVGPDLAEKLSGTGLQIQVVLGPEGHDRRIVWEARKPR